MSLWEPSTTHDVVRWICVFSCLLSIGGSLGIIIAYYLYPALRKPARHLLLWLSVADLGTALIYIITIIGCYDCKHCSEPTKLATSLIGVFFPVSSFLWTDCIALYIFGASYQLKWATTVRQLFCSFHLVSWILPLVLILIITVIYYVQDQHMRFSSDYTGGWCWVDRIGLQLLGGKAVEWFSIVFLSLIYFFTFCRLRSIKKFRKKIEMLTKEEQQGMGGSMFASRRSAAQFSTDHGKINELLTRLTLIPLIFLVLRAPGSVRVVLVYLEVIAKGGETDDLLAILQALCDPLQGFCNGVLFLLCVSAVRTTIFHVQAYDPRYHDMVVTTKTTTGTQDILTDSHKNTITSLSTPILEENIKTNPLL